MALTLTKARRVFAFLIICVFFGPLDGHAQRSWEADPTTLDGILRDARAGDDISLAPGTYSDVVLRNSGNGDAPLVLRSADPVDMAQLTDLLIDNSSNVALRDLRLIQSDSAKQRPFRVLDSREIDLDGLELTGLAASSSTGLSLANVQRVTVQDTTFSGFSRGAVFTDAKTVLFTGNTLHSITEAGLMFRQVEAVQIESNVFRDFLPTKSAGHIGTMVQFSTTDTQHPSVGIVVRDNLMTSGDGAATQSILLRNQLVEQGKAGPDMFYRDITIEENLIINAHANGIAIGPSDGVLVRRNTVVQNAMSKGEERNENYWTPIIRLDDISRDAIILGNVAHGLPEARWQTDWIIAGNLKVQNAFPTDANHYDRVFASVSPTSVARPSDFVARPGGPLDGVELGSPRLVGLSEELISDNFALLREQQGLYEVIRFDPDEGTLIGYGGAGAEDRLQRTLGGTIEIGRGNTALQLTTEMSAPYFEAEAFRFSLRIRPSFGSSSAGEVLRIHTNLVVSVTDRGRYRVDLTTRDGRPVRLRSRPTDLFSRGYADLTLEYDATSGLLTLKDDTNVIGEVRSRGPTRVRESWGITFGNPFGTRKSFDGTIEAFSLEVRHPVIKPLTRAEARP